MDTTDPPQVRAAKLLKHMNFTEKTMMRSARDSEDDAMGFYIGLVETSHRLGMPWLRMNQNFQPTRPGTNTNWPSALTIGATFDRNMARLWGKSMGKEIAGEACVGRTACSSRTA
jgi:beta-glucosidase-like glycosyl hydrolase